MRPADPISEFQSRLRDEGLHSALAFLNSRTPFRFTGVYVFDGRMLRNVALFDRWEPELRRASDSPMDETFCSIVGQLGELLEVTDGGTDPRFPRMHENAVQSYCGSPIKNSDGRAMGTLCHFDLKPCQAPSSELPILREAARHIYPVLREQFQIPDMRVPDPDFPGG